jgi:hypothetical protein
MKQILGIVLAAVIVISVAPYARSLGMPSPPPGVSADDWIPLGEAAGFVIAHNNSAAASTNRADGTVKGYFMVRHTNSWFRVDPIPDYGVQKVTMQR